MSKLRYIAIILSVAGFTIAGVGSLWDSSWDQNFIAKGGPYAGSVGIVGLGVFFAGIYLLMILLTEQKK
jgi:hypothetical protein